MQSLPPIDFDRVSRMAGDLRDLISRDIHGSGRSEKFACPFHSLGSERTPSLQVYDDHYHCYACNAHGDAVSWIAHREGLTMVQAAKYLDPTLETAQDRQGGHPSGLLPKISNPSLKPHHGNARAVPEHPVANPSTDKPDVWKLPEYQSKIDALVCGAEDLLWPPKGRPALDWLRRRGLTEETIRRFRLGFFPLPHSTVNHVPGLFDRHGKPSHLRAVRGVTIPWLAPGAKYYPRDGHTDGPRWVGMNVRRLADPVEAPLTTGDKCMAVRGSRRGYLYPFPDIASNKGPLPMLLVEGEFDAMIGYQQAGHLVHVGTAGGSSTNPRKLPVETRGSGPVSLDLSGIRRRCGRSRSRLEMARSFSAQE